MFFGYLEKNNVIIANDKLCSELKDEIQALISLCWLEYRILPQLNP